jgi:hypothetical protein
VSTPLAFVVITIVAAINAVVVLGASLLGVSGDGTPGSMYVVLSVGWSWTAVFYFLGLYRMSRGEHQAGINLTLKTIPYAIVLVVLGGVLWVGIAIVRDS